MSWYGDAINTVGNGLGTVYDGIRGAVGSVTDDPGAAAEARRKLLLQQQAKQAGYFAGQSQDSYQQLGGQGQGALDALRAQAQGQSSVSAEQLRQSLGQLVAQQRSLAAGASPRNAALAARTAAIQSGRLGAGLAGQQAIAGLQERNQAQQQYGQLLQGLRVQDLNAALGSRQTAVTGYGAGNAGTPEKSTIEKYGPAALGFLGAISDRALKTDIRPGDAAANKATAALDPYAYRYKDPRYGSGPQVGVMAQDLEKAGLKQAVVDTPAGKAIDPGKLSGANTAMIAALGRRVAELEGGKAPRRTVELAEIDPRTGAPPDRAAWAAQRQLDARRAALDPDAARRNRVYDQVQIEQTDPQAAAAQYALNARRAALAEADRERQAAMRRLLASRAAEAR